ncbi:hypothetical protein LMG28688_01588 [Paraburkholderia caffeinitolerans]|uniref:Transmembrane protein n=1 Tax=Paraburkholderia caffeinitolerans TaxID=1723730 RepID=A0A6J5FR20_9BURK|nr:hypothetical protein [Paraburkholderia caffeinitolerans]CAB3783145.1 hypothetical protein LMG28688_01588 [Paraburkholderia caffeinitolerans]
MKSQLFSGLLAPLAEIVLGWYWLAGGHDVAGRLLTFYWWLTVAVLFGFSFLVVIVRMVLDRAWPTLAPSSRASRLWMRSLFFARVIAQVAIGCTTLAVLSLSAWLFCRLALLIAFDGETKGAET